MTRRWLRVGLICGFSLLVVVGWNAWAHPPTSSCPGGVCTNTASTSVTINTTPSVLAYETAGLHIFPVGTFSDTQSTISDSDADGHADTFTQNLILTASTSGNSCDTEDSTTQGVCASCGSNNFAAVSAHDCAFVEVGVDSTTGVLSVTGDTFTNLSDCFVYVGADIDINQGHAANFCTGGSSLAAGVTLVAAGSPATSGRVEFIVSCRSTYTFKGSATFTLKCVRTVDP